MSIEGVNGLNSKDLKNVETDRPKTKKLVLDAPKTSRKQRSAPKDGDGSSLKDLVEISSVDIKSRELFEPQVKKDTPEGETSRPDSLEISFQDQDHKERIRETIELVKETRARLAERLEEARLLLLNSVYDDPEEITKTVDNLMNGEDIARLGVEDM